MTPTGILLYGPPGAGKDTVSARLIAQSDIYVSFQRLKAGPGRKAGYRLTTSEHIDTLAMHGDLMYRNSRYEAEYAVDRAGLAEIFNTGQIPLLHLGQLAGIRAVEAYPARWIRVLLWCPMETTRERCRARGDHDLSARLRAWEETRKDLDNNPQFHWSLIIETQQQAPDTTAIAIDRIANDGDVDAAKEIG